MSKPARGRPPTYPFGEMKVGDERTVSAPQTRVGPAACAFARGRGWKFMCRTNGQGTRVWRIK